MDSIAQRRMYGKLLASDCKLFFQARHPLYDSSFFGEIKEIRTV